MKRTVCCSVVLFVTLLLIQSVKAEVKYERGFIGRTLVKSATLHSANGFYFDSHDRIHLANLISHEVHTLDSETGEVLATIDMEDGVITPDDITVGPDDSVYWTSVLSGQIGRQNPDGTIEIIAQLPPGANGISFSEEGLLYIGNYINGEVYEIDPTGQLPFRTIAVTYPTLEGMDFGPDGHLYIPTLAFGIILQVNVQTGEVVPVYNAEPGMTSVKFDSRGDMYVVQTDGRVLKVDIIMGTASVYAEFPTFIETVAFDSQDRMFVSNGTAGDLYRVEPNGTITNLLRSGIIAGGGMATVLRNCRQSLFVADTFTIKEYNPWSGRLKNTTIYEGGDPATTLQPVFTIAPLGENMLVTSWFGNAVQIWDPETRSVIESHTDFAVPVNAIEFQGDMVVAELMTGAIVKRTPGTSQRVVLAEGLYVPTGMTTDNSGNLWVADWATGIIWQVVVDGVIQSPSVPVASDLTMPEGIAVDHRGRLIVVETGAQRLVRIDPATGEKQIIASNLPVGIPPAPDTPPHWILNGVTIDRFGAIYVSSDLDNKILKIWPLEVPK